MAQRRAGIGDGIALRAGQEACGWLAADARLVEAPRYVLYVATRGELSTRALTDRALAGGRAVLWPRVAGAGQMEFVDCPEGDLVSGRFGIPAPPAALAASPLRPGDVVLVPGLAFDPGGGRLGRGGGYYDRALDAAPEGVIFVGLGYAFQCVDEVPMERTDRRMHALLSEEGLLWVAK